MQLLREREREGGRKRERDGEREGGVGHANLFSSEGLQPVAEVTFSDSPNSLATVLHTVMM